MQQEVLDLLALCRIEGVNWHLVAREARRPGGLHRLLRGEVTETGAEAEAARDALRIGLDAIDANRETVGKWVRDSVTRGIRITTVLDEDFPLNLRTIFNLPPFLLYRGTLSAEEDARSVAIVGTREASKDGLKRARKLADLLVKAGVTVLSGLARGIDTAAHEAALEANGRTVAVFGTGINRTYPPENERLAERIAERGATVSQFWPDTPPTTYTFPRRNVTMSGMGQGTVVVEATSTSGAKMQARLALQHGKKVFLLRALVTSQPWARKYLERGAIEVTDVKDILEKLHDAERIRQSAERAVQLSLEL